MAYTRHGSTSRARPAGAVREVLDVDADHGLAEPARDLRDHVGVVVERGRLDDRLGPLGGVAGLEDARSPTKTPSAPSCIIIAASAGVAMPPAVKSTTGSLPLSATSVTRSYGACSSFAATYSSSGDSDPSRRISCADGAHVRDRVGDVAGAGLALGADHRRALGDPAQRLAQVGRTADERDRERPLVDVVGVVGRGEHLGLVDVVHAEALQHLRLGEVADARLGHHRDRDAPR